MSDSRDRQIQVGDLVQVVRPSICIGGNDGLGHTFTVLSIAHNDQRRKLGAKCIYCKKLSHYVGMQAEDVKRFWPTARLRRILPLEELEGQRTEETLRTPLRVPAVTHSGEEGR